MNKLTNKLTDLYYLLQINKDDPYSVVFQDSFRNYLLDQTPRDFCLSVMVYGFEVRDIEFKTYERYVLGLESVVSEVYNTKFKNTIDFDEELFPIYAIGMANLYMFFCKRTGYNTTNLGLDEDNATMISLAQSIDYIRKAMMLLDDAMNMAKGLYLYQTIKSLDYLWSVLENYKVENNNIPPDLDSSYIWVDQVPDGELWDELVVQMRKKYQIN